MEIKNKNQKKVPFLSGPSAPGKPEKVKKLLIITAKKDSLQILSIIKMLVSGKKNSYT
jgi:hypothetical protein